MNPFSAAPVRGHKAGSPWIVLLRTKLGLPAVILSCSVFFFVGFYGSVLISQDLPDEGVPRGRLMEVTEGEMEWPAMPSGESGESRASLIPFQVLSWNPRALYFPRFAMADQCQTIIQIAKSKLTPSTLALRKGETEVNTKGIRTSSGTFLSASEDSTGVLKQIEQKIARVTMIPRENGEEALKYFVINSQGYHHVAVIQYPAL